MKLNRKPYDSPSMIRHDGLVEIAAPKHDAAQSSAAPTKPVPIKPPPPAPKDR